MPATIESMPPELIWTIIILIIWAVYSFLKKAIKLAFLILSAAFIIVIIVWLT